MSSRSYLKCKQYWNNFIRMIFPVHPITLIILHTTSCYTNLYCFDYFYNINKFLQLSEFYTTQFILILFFYTALSFILATSFCIAFCYLMRNFLIFLHSYTEWFFDNPKNPSINSKIWILLLKIVLFFAPRNNSLYSRQSCLPYLPLPRVEATVQRLLKSLKPIQDIETFGKTTSLANEFLNNESRKLQAILKKRRRLFDIYLGDWWLQYAYLSCGRTPVSGESFVHHPGVVIHSNVGLSDCIGSGEKIQQCSRAAVLSHYYLRIKDLIEHGLMPLSTCPGNNLIPMCSNQNKNIFSVSRIPQLGRDELSASPFQLSNHIVVMSAGKYYLLSAYHSDGQLSSCKELESAFEEIINDKTVPSEGEALLATMTAAERDLWANFRNKYILSSDINRKSINFIDTCAFIVNLDATSPSLGKVPAKLFSSASHLYPPVDPSFTGNELSDYCISILAGHSGCDRWFDKLQNLIIYKNGVCGFSCEHSPCDGPILNLVINILIAVEKCYDLKITPNLQKDIMNLFDSTGSRYDADGFVKGPLSSKVTSFRKLEWEFDNISIEELKIQHKATMFAITSLELEARFFEDFGRRSMKQYKISPDAFVQMAIQLAFYRMNRRLCPTYESAMTRLFRNGRTETIRTASDECLAFVVAFIDESKNPTELFRLFNIAIKKHTLTTKEAMIGRGCDRHLLALYIAGKENGINSDFLSYILNIPWELSTSQVPMNPLNFNISERPDVCIPCGAFGPVIEDGYGIPYFFIGEDIILFNVSTIKDSIKTDAKRFSILLFQSLNELLSLCKVVSGVKI